MRYSELFGDDIQADIEAIKQELDENSDAVFVYTGPDTLYDYITRLHQRGRGLDDDYLYRFRVCYERKNLYLTYYGGKTETVDTMSGLTGLLDPNHHCRIVVESDDRVELAEIMQQLIYLQYPLDTVELLLRREEQDAGKTSRFMDRISSLMDGCDAAVESLSELWERTDREKNEPTREVRLKDIAETLAACRAMQEQLKDAMDVELKVAVAASKKAGKSVIVNCLLGQEIAPTGTELATPNNCVYRRSSDSMYSLLIEEEGEEPSFFPSRQELRETMMDWFRDAQNSRDTGFALPDMQVRYATDGNNFSAYTIYDTAGPDAAGTEHEPLALEAMQKCDVAVFAIDYSKFLTTSEEAYLREVKRMFSSKSHSLIFVLNKMDVRYTDEDAPKSFIMSVDFVKTRLADIDEAYRDCVIFPTSAKEYFSVLEAEKAGVKELEQSVTPELLRQIAFDRKDVPSLKWLHGHSEFLDYYHGVSAVSYDVFRRDSGMPAMMEYVAYVARSKTREEIINNVASQIAIQKVRVQSILDAVSNLEALIQTSDEKIKHISQIITEYTNSVEEIFSQNCNPNDLAVLEPDSILSRFDGVYEKMIEYQDETLKETCEVSVVADNIYHVVVDVIWNRLNDKLQTEGQISGRDINSLFTAKDFNVVVNSVIKVEAGRSADEISGQLDKLRHEMEQIAAYRQKRLAEVNQKCRSALSKEDVEIKLPDLPAFAFATQMVSPREVPDNMYQTNLNLFHDLGFLFEKKLLPNVGMWLSNTLKGRKVVEEDYKRTLKATQEEFQEACSKYLRADIVNSVYTDKIADQIYEPLKAAVVDKYICGLVGEARRAFDGMNHAYKACGEQFRAAVDDRDQYKADIALHEKRRETILSIQAAMTEFMESWNGVVSNLTEKTKVESGFIRVN
ncbi:MAG: dynamin family protein [Oscillospiraceae bacterium]|nr:dynamin family protein [Oscillospiraceae bacterium]